MILHFIKNVKNINTNKWLIRAVFVTFFLVFTTGLAFFSGYFNTVSFSPLSTTPENLPTSTPIASSTEEIISAFPEIALPGEIIKEEKTMSENKEVALAPGLTSPTLPPSIPIEVGVFAGTIPELYTFEHRVGEQVDIAATAVHWGNERDFPQAYANLVTGRGTTLLIYWYPMDYRKEARDQDAFHFSEILDGSWDEYIESFAQAAAQNSGDIIIAPFEEANGNWTYWNGNSGAYGTKEEYIETFRYLHDKLKSAPNVRIAWVVNHVSVPNTSENAITTYYPGDAYVDLIGINAFNFGTPWLSFDSLISRAVGEVLPYHKPIYITSTASAPGEQKAAWIREMFASTYFTHSTLKGFIWFNENKERDWSVWSDVSSEEIFRDALKNDS